MDIGKTPLKTNDSTILCGELTVIIARVVPLEKSNNKRKGADRSAPKTLI